MPVNTAALKTFAPAMRRQLLEAVGRKLDLLLNSQTPDTLSTYANQIAELRGQEAENREQLLERVAYTWFNRLCALRYMDARGWHPFGCKVLMPAAEGETQPELLKLMRAGSLPAELKPHTNEARLHGLLDGRIPPAMAGADPQGEVYRELVLASCRSYHQLLPELFERLDDASELLLPDDMLSEGSIAGGFRSAISDEDCEDVEIIGWLYQFYISEKKDQVIGKVVKSEDIPAATQLFTPNWIVKYMVQNSLGATWLATYPDSPLKGQMEFYIEPAEQTPEVQAQLAAITPESLDPEALTLIDPACGSGHILVEAYDLLKAVYLERGFQMREIPKLILENNIFGLDIDERAAQLTIFALMMKGRADDRRLLEKRVKLNVMALVSGARLDVASLTSMVDLSRYGVSQSDLVMIKKIFEKAPTLGSLIRTPPDLAERISVLEMVIELTSKDLVALETLKSLVPLVRQAKLLAAKYDIAIANPPYMGSGGMNALLKRYVVDNYSDEKENLFACFVERCCSLAKTGGLSALVTMHNWMFLSSFQKMREELLQNKTITTMAHLGSRAFGSISGEVVQTVSFVLRNKPPGAYRPVFFRLLDGDEDRKRASLVKGENRFAEIAQNQFTKIPGSPVAYWVSERLRSVFEKGKLLDELVDAREGLGTRDDSRFIRLWAEVAQSAIGYGCEDRGLAEASGKRWFPCNKGGPFRRWYGNRDYMVDWEADGRAIKSFRDASGKLRSRPQNQEYYFSACVSWSDITSGPIAFRIFESGFISNDTGMPAYGNNRVNQYFLLAFCNAPIIGVLSKIINPTLHFKVGNFKNIPFVEKIPAGYVESVVGCCKQLVVVAQTDWDAYERSWDFKSLPLLSFTAGSTRTLKSSYNAWITHNKLIIDKARSLEEENNSIFIEAYGLKEELAPDVPIDQITLTVNPAYRYGGNLAEDEQWARFRRDTMAEFLSYATGCMMGRYSLDHPGLILADSRDSQAEQFTAYEDKVGKSLSEVQFKPDLDGIIPVLDGEWFEDDIVARTREFLTVTFPESSVGENLRFIEESLGKDIRKYFCSEFYKDHLQTYKKRPIYWMVQSPKKGFGCLIYLHRYTKDTLNQVLNNYFRPYLQKLEARLAQLGLDQLNDDLPSRERTAARKEAEKINKVLKECQAWEQDALLPLAQQRIQLDLDDGVKVNYLKLQDVLAKIPGLAAKEA